MTTTATRKHNEIADAPHCRTRQASRNPARASGASCRASPTWAKKLWILRSAGQHSAVAIATARSQHPRPIHGQSCETADLSPANNRIAPSTGVR